MKLQKNSPKLATLCASLITCSTLGLFALPAIAQPQTEPAPAASQQSTSQQTKSFDLPAGTLGTALNRAAQQAGVAISFAADEVAGKTVPALKGEYSINVVFSQLLAGSELNVHSTGAGYVVSSGGDLIMMSPLKVGGTALNTASSGALAYREGTSYAPSTTRSNVAIMDTARSVQVINRNFIEDVDAQSLEEALQYVSATSPRLRLGGVDTEYYIRGFRAGSGYRNGKREMFRNRVNMDTVETIDVLKGPASVRFGVNSPGGIVNYTTKKPEVDARTSITTRFDEHGKKEIIGDFNGIANESGNILYRLILAGEDSESFRDFSEEKSSTVAPSVTFLLSDKTQLSIAYELNKTEIPLDRGIPIGELSDGTYAIADVPIERRFSEPGDHSVDDTQLFDMTLAHTFNEKWQGDLSYSYQNWDSNWSDMQNEGFDIETGDMDRERLGYIYKEEETHQVSALLHGDFVLADVKHKLTVGADYSSTEQEGLWGEGAAQPSANYPSTFNLYNPVYGEVSKDLVAADFDTEKTDTWGLFVSETAYFGDRFILNFAMRYDSYEYEYSEEYEDPTDNFYEGLKEEALTWNAGLLYKVMPETSLYLSYSTSYEPNSADNLVGELKPQEGEQIEIGIKGLAMNDRFQYSLSFYDISKSNIPNDFEDAEGNDLVRLIGEQTSKGFDLDMAFQVNDDFSVMVNYAYIDAEISKNEESPEEVGNTPEGVAKNSASLFLSYTLTSLIPNLTVLAGVNYADDVPNRSDNRFNRLMIPGATKYNLGLKYEHALEQGSALLLHAGVKNLTDERIYIQQGNGNVGVGQARTIYANIEYQL
ncbi:MAG: TonB-dependent receptor [Cycloclasticus sp.]